MCGFRRVPPLRAAERPLHRLAHLRHGLRLIAGRRPTDAPGCSHVSASVESNTVKGCCRSVVMDRGRGQLKVMNRPVSSSDELSQPQRSARPGALDAGAFDALFGECAADIHAYAISLLGDRAAAEDVTALAFERLYRARRRLDLTAGRRAGVAVFDRAQRCARRAAHAGAPRLELERGCRRASARTRSSASPGRARTVLAGRSRSCALRERELVLLKFHGQLSNGELARALGISESNAGTRLHRALTRLRECCADLDRQEVA